MSNYVRIGNKDYYVDSAETFFSRLMGLMGREDMPSNEALFISPCNSIHTFFMNFPITVVFVDENMRVTYVRRDIHPRRLCFPPFGSNSYSVFELPSEGNEDLDVKVGDEIISYSIDKSNHNKGTHHSRDSSPTYRLSENQSKRLE